MVLFIDFQGFKIENNQFLVKELAGFDGHKVCHCLFEPPFPFESLPKKQQQQASWLIRNHHCIEWNEGTIPLQHLERIVHKLIDSTSPDCLVYVKGKEKANYLRKLTNKPVFELKEQPRLTKTKPKCFSHRKDNCFCALSNVYYLYEIFLNKETEL